MDQNGNNRESQGLVDKVKQCTRNMAHNVSKMYSTPKVQSRMALAKGGLCAFILLPLINLLSLLIGHAELYYGFCYENMPMQLLGIYLLVVWVYVTSIAWYHFYIPQPSNRFPPKITRCFRIGHALVVFVGALIIFGTFSKPTFFDRPIKPYFEIDQELLLVVGFVINVVYIIVIFIMRPDKGPWGEIILPPFEVNVYRHIKCCSFGAVISMLVHELDQIYGFEIRRDIILLSYYFWVVLYCFCSDMGKLFDNIRTGNIMKRCKTPEVIVIKSSNNV